MKKQIGAAVVLLFACGSAAVAQEPESERDLDRRVDVSREYMPDMDRAAKLTIAPVMNDTVALRPDLEYTVNPSPWVTGFGVAAINPVRVDAASFEQLLPFYLKAGFGISSRSVFDFYGTTTATRGGYAGGYLNHTGNWSKLENYFGNKERALESHNKIGIFGRTYLGRRIALSAEIGYDYDIYSKYNFSGVAALPRTVTASELMSYSVPRLAVEIGNDFTDLSSFNFAVGAEGYLLQGRRDAKESGFKAKIAMGKIFNIHQLKLSAMYDGAYGGGMRDGYDINILSVTPSYLLEEGMLRFGAGVEIAYAKDKLADKSKAYFLPSAEFALRLADGAFTPFAKLRSEVVSNSYRSQTRRLPFITEDYGNLMPSRDYKLYGGVRGDVASNFSYELRIGYGIIRDAQFHLLSPATGYFRSLTYNKLKYFTAGGSLSGRISDSFNAGLDVDYYNYSVKDNDLTIDAKTVSGRPEFTGNIYFSYNWQDKLLLKLRGGLTGTRYFMTSDILITDVPGVPPGTGILLTADYGKISSVFDLGIDADYRLTKNLGVFLSGDNLLNRKLYPWYGYRGFGIGVTAGVKFLF